MQYISYGIFGLLAVITLVGALKVVMARSIMHAAFWLFPVFAGVAGFYLLLDAQFLAAIQVLIYIGAILVLIVFAVTLTRNSMDPDDVQHNGLGWPVLLAAILLILALTGAVLVSPWGQAIASLDGVTLLPNLVVTEVSALGLVLLQSYLLPFEIASVLLLAAMVGAIVLARRESAAPEPYACEAEDPACAVPSVEKVNV